MMAGFPEPSDRRWSASGTKWTYEKTRSMSAFGGKADIAAERAKSGSPARITYSKTN
jgi:hypothetical protein